MKLLDLRREPGARERLREGLPSWEGILRRVRRIVEEVRRGGDGALLRLTLRYDGVRLRREELRVGREEISAAYRKVDRGTLRSLRVAARAVERYHRRQLPRPWFATLSPGVRAGQLVLPLDRVGVYVPGGLASYPSTALHTLIPARVAGVRRLVVCTPPGPGG
ncbi:MAG: histidinol dehydrogenase, partial [Hadesarchaea archaeon]